MDRNNETIRLAKKAADAWRTTDTYHQAAQIIDMLISALEGDTTLTPPNEPLTLEQLQEMDGEPVYSGKYKRWFLVTYFAVLNRSQLMDSTGTPFVADDCGPLYLCPPEGEEN